MGSGVAHVRDRCWTASSFAPIAASGATRNTTSAGTPAGCPSNRSRYIDAQNPPASGDGSAARVVPGQASARRARIFVVMSRSSVTVFTVTVISDRVYGMPNPADEAVVARTLASEWTVDVAGRRASPCARSASTKRSGSSPHPRRPGSHRALRDQPPPAAPADRPAPRSRRPLAGISDLLGRWSARADLGEVLGLEPDQLVHVDEPGRPRPWTSCARRSRR